MDEAIDSERIARITAEVLEELRLAPDRPLGTATAAEPSPTAARIRPYLETRPGTQRTEPPRAVNGASLAPDRLGLSPDGRPTVTCNVSNRHIHLTQESFATLFGAEAELTPRNSLMQPGQFAAEQTVSLIAGRGRAIENVRILGPLRRYTQVEISRTDGFYLGIRPPLRASGSIEGSAGGTLVGPKGTLVLVEGLIVADRHIHTPMEVARRFGLANNQYIRVRVFHSEKPTVLERVRIRVSEQYLLEMHVDTDDANAAEIASGDRVELIL